ncbi:MAG: AbrB/MazE/SpoVT family DNA-binding domain-containing protein [archaeon]
MKKFMDKCYFCKSKLKVTKTKMDNITLDCMRCPKCKEEYFTSDQMIKYDILTGRRQDVRKFGTLGDSTIMRFPTNILKHFKIKPGDYGRIQETKDGILIKPIHAKEL